MRVGLVTKYSGHAGDHCSGKYAHHVPAGRQSPPLFFFSFWGMYFRRCDCMRFIGLSRPRVSHGRRSCQPLLAVCLAVCLAGCLSVRWMRPQPSLISGWYPIGHYWHYSIYIPWVFMWGRNMYKYSICYGCTPIHCKSTYTVIKVN